MPGARSDGGYQGTDLAVQGPSQIIKKSVGYVAEGTVTTQLLSISKTPDTGADQTQQTPDPKEVIVKNTGRIPVVVLLGYEGWSGATADAAIHYLQTLLLPQSSVTPPMAGIIPTADLGEVYDGTIIDFANTANYVDSGTLINDASVEAADTTLTVDDGSIFRVNDLIQLGINSTAATKIEIMRVTSIATHVLTVDRALFGTTANDYTAQTSTGGYGSVDNQKVLFPFFNEYQDWNRYTTPQTDGGGRFKAKNLYGYGRTAGSEVFGITPGSLVLKWYSAGYQNLTDDGDITGSTNSGLTAGKTYYLSISIDGGTTDAETFVVDSSNQNFAGANGIIAKLQAIVDANYYNPAKNGYEKRATFGIVDGNLRITSGQRTAVSAVLVSTNEGGTKGTHAAGGDELYDLTNALGRFGAIAPAAVGSSLPPDVIYDPLTYAATENTSAFCYDDGLGVISGAECDGTINYETGAISIQGPVNADFQVSCIHSGPFSGMQDSTEPARANQLVSIHANVQNKKMNGEVEIEVRN